MKAICIMPDHRVKLNNVPMPKKAVPGHIIVKMEACGINSGDKAFIAGAFPPGSIPESLYDICGVSGAGKVLEVGDGVPQKYISKNIAVYKSLKFSDNIVGTWSEYAHMHYHHCIILPDNVDMEEYSGLISKPKQESFLSWKKSQMQCNFIQTTEAKQSLGLPDNIRSRHKAHNKLKEN